MTFLKRCSAGLSSPAAACSVRRAGSSPRACSCSRAALRSGALIVPEWRQALRVDCVVCELGHRYSFLVYLPPSPCRRSARGCTQLREPLAVEPPTRPVHRVEASVRAGVDDPVAAPQRPTVRRVEHRDAARPLACAAVAAKAVAELWPSPVGIDARMTIQPSAATLPPPGVPMTILPGSCGTCTGVGGVERGRSSPPRSRETRTGRAGPAASRHQPSVFGPAPPSCASANGSCARLLQRRAQRCGVVNRRDRRCDHRRRGRSSLESRWLELPRGFRMLGSSIATTTTSTQRAPATKTSAAAPWPPAARRRPWSAAG